MSRRKHVAIALTVTPLATLAMVLTTTTPAYADADADLGAAISQELPQANGLPTGSGETSAQGDFTYTVPIEVPPGRRGEQPNLALRYSSAAPVHGGIAAGWSLPIPSVTVDPQSGTIRPQWPTGGSPGQPRPFVGPDGSPLVPDPSLPVGMGGVGYRSATDSSFTRFEFLGQIASSPNWWVAHSADGSRSYFGLKNQSPYSYAPLVSRIDNTGHELRYAHRVVGRTGDAAPEDGHPREILLDRISYLSPATGGLYAEVSFEYSGPAFCGNPSGLPAVGSKLDYRLGFGQLTGTRKLNTIKTWRRSPTGTLTAARTYTLGYAATDSCTNGNTTPFRQLASVQQTAHSPNIPAGEPGGVTALPPIEFTYGKAASYVRDAHYGPEQDLANAAMPASVETLVREDGYRSDGICTAKFCPDVSPSALDYSGPLVTLSQYQTMGENVQSLWLDINGDGRIDQLRTQQATLASSAPPTGGCQVEAWINLGQQGFVKNHQFSFSLRDAFADIPVAAAPGSDGDGELLCSLNRSFTSVNSGWYGDASTTCRGHADVYGRQWDAPVAWGSIQKVSHAFVDMDGDRRLDLVSVPTTSVMCPYASTRGIRPFVELDDDPNTGRNYDDWHGNDYVATQKYMYVYRNTGSGFDTAPQIIEAAGVASTPQIEKVAYQPTPSVTSERYWKLVGDNPGYTLVDFNGDGVADGVHSDGFINVGTSNGALAMRNRVELDGPLAQVGVCSTCELNTSLVSLEGLTVDVNGDGLPDSYDYKSIGDVAEVRFNTGAAVSDGYDGHTMFFSKNLPNAGRLIANATTITQRDPEKNGVTAGIVVGRNRFVDLDYDGFGDVLNVEDSGVTTLFLNGGGAWLETVNGDSGSVASRLAGRLEAGGISAVFGSRTDYRWRMAHQAIDVNGDGLLDLLHALGNGSVRVRYAKPVIDSGADTNAPARLMRTVKNGFGAKTTVSYDRNCRCGHLRQG